MSLLRRRPVPASVKAVPLPPGERRTAWAVTEAGEPVVATGGSLVLPDGTRLAWGEVEKATWQPPRLTVTEVAEVEGTGLAHVLVLEQEGELPATVRARVTASVAWSSHERLAPSGGVRVVGRRSTGQDALTWQLVYDAGTDRDDPLVRAQAEALLDQARQAIG